MFCFILQVGGIGYLFGGTKPNKATLWRRDWLRVLSLEFEGATDTTQFK